MKTIQTIQTIQTMKKNQTMKTLSLFTIITAIVLLISSCKKDDNDDIQLPGNEEELITTVELEFINDSSNQISIFEFSDPDGFGGNAPTQFDTIRLNKAAVYSLSIKFYDKSDTSDIEDITLEILEEAKDHLVCFDISPLVTGLSIQKTDSDGTFPIGLASKWTLSQNAISTNGSVTITLKHQPSVKDGSCNPGDTDVEVEFPLIFN